MAEETRGAASIRVVIVDDHEMVREMLINVFSTLTGYTIISQAKTGLEAIKICLKEKPDLVLLDAAMPEFNGLDTFRELTDKIPRTRFLILSGAEDQMLPVRFIQAGAQGFVKKTEPLQVLVNAIHTVAMGGNYYQTKQKNLLQQVLTSPVKEEVLTQREKQVLQLVAEGFITKEIAAKLDMGLKTAETHRTNLMRKLNIHDVAGLTRYAINSGSIIQ